MPQNNRHNSDIAHVAQMLDRIAWCDRYTHALELAAAENDASARSKHRTKKSFPPAAIIDIACGPFELEAYECGMVPRRYYNDIETILPWDQAGTPIMNPSPQFLAPLTPQQTLACIAYHFRADYFCCSSLMEDSLPNGSLLQLMKAYREKALAEVSRYDDAVISKALLKAFKKRAS